MGNRRFWSANSYDRCGHSRRDTKDSKDTKDTKDTPGRVGFIQIVFKDVLTFDMLDIDSTGNMNFSADLQICKMCAVTTATLYLRY